MHVTAFEDCFCKIKLFTVELRQLDAGTSPGAAEQGGDPAAFDPFKDIETATHKVDSQAAACCLLAQESLELSVPCAPGAALLRLQNT